jgi:hypothetical protein
MAVSCSLARKMLILTNYQHSPLFFGSAAMSLYTQTKSKLEGEIVRKIYANAGVVGIAIALTISGTAVAGPLAPGKPAGVHQAQAGDKEWLVFGGLAVLGATILIATAGGGHTDAPAQVPTVVTTSATAP